MIFRNLLREFDCTFGNLFEFRPVSLIDASITAKLQSKKNVKTLWKENITVKIVEHLTFKIWLVMSMNYECSL